MVQMPVDPSMNLVFHTGIKGLHSWRMIMLDLTEEKRFDEDLAKCMLRWTLKQGGVLKIIRNQGSITAQIDQQVIKGSMHNAFIEKLIKPLIENLQKQVYPDPVSKNDVYSTITYWDNGLPGITKIKIKAFSYGNHITYTLNHKMGKDGGKNYHNRGIFNGLNKSKE